MLPPVNLAANIPDKTLSGSPSQGPNTSPLSITATRVSRTAATKGVSKRRASGQTLRRSIASSNWTIAKDVSGPLIKPAASLVGCQPVMLVTKSPNTSTTNVVPSCRPKDVERLNHQPRAVSSRITTNASTMTSSLGLILLEDYEI